jgi:hypothetical protein
MAFVEETMTQANYALRLQASLKAEAERLAKAEGTTLNQFINVAVAEKIAALRTADFFRERARAPTSRPLSASSIASAMTTRRVQATRWSRFELALEG